VPSNLTDFYLINNQQVMKRYLPKKGAFTPLLPLGTYQHFFHFARFYGPIVDRFCKPLVEEEV
jgi:hypothetical protein